MMSLSKGGRYWANPSPVQRPTLRSIGLFLRSSSPHPHDLLEESAAARVSTGIVEGCLLFLQLGKRTNVIVVVELDKNPKRNLSFSWSFILLVGLRQQSSSFTGIKNRLPPSPGLACHFGPGPLSVQQLVVSRAR